MSDLIQAFDAFIDDSLQHLSDHAGFFFDALQARLNDLNGAILWVLNLSPFYVVALVAGLLGWRLVNLRTGILSALALVLCELMGLWPETVGTLALVITSTLLALIIAVPAGIFAGSFAGINRLADPVMDLLQTLPPYIYLLPGIALLGYGPATAVVSTFIVAVPPAFRLSALGMKMTPFEFVELGLASGVTRRQMFFKIRLPFALPSIMAGVNQSLMMAFGMVVIAGIVGSGGLGQTIYDAIRKLEIGKSIDAAIAIVVLTMILDRLSQSMVRTSRDGAEK